MSLPRRFSAPRLLVAALAALSVGLVAGCGTSIGALSSTTDERHAQAHGHGHGSGRNQRGSFRKPGTGRKYRLR